MAKSQLAKSKLIRFKHLKVYAIFEVLTENCTCEDFAEKFKANYPDDASKIYQMYQKMNQNNEKKITVEQLVDRYINKMFENGKKEFIERKKESYFIVNSNCDLFYHLSDIRMLNYVHHVIVHKHNPNNNIWFFRKTPELLKCVGEFIKTV